MKTLINSMSQDLIEWFSFAARQILEGKVALTRQTTKLLSKYRKQLKKLAHHNVDSLRMLPEPYKRKRTCQ